MNIAFEYKNLTLKKGGCSGGAKRDAEGVKLECWKSHHLNRLVTNLSPAKTYIK